MVNTTLESTKKDTTGNETKPGVVTEPIKDNLTKVVTAEPINTQQAQPTSEITQKEPSKSQKVLDTAKFGYDTTPQEREKRNQDLAQQFFEGNAKNMNTTLLTKMVAKLAPGTTAQEQQSTAQDIMQRYELLVDKKRSVDAINEKTAGFNMMTVEEMAKLSSAERAELMKYAPDQFNKLAEYEKDQKKLDKLNGDNKKITEEVVETTTPSSSLNDIYKMIGNISKVPTIDIMKVRNELFDTPAMKDAQSTLRTKEKEVKDLQNEMDSVLDSVRERLKGTGATENYIRAIAQKELGAIQKQYNAKINEYELARGTYNDLQSNATQSLEIQLQQYSIDRQQAQANISNFQLAYGIFNDQQTQARYAQDREDKWDMLYAEQGFRREQEASAWENTMKKYDIEFGNIDSTDINAQKNGINNMVSGIMNNFTAMGVTFQRSVSMITNDIISGIKKGGKPVNSENVSNYIQKNLLPVIKDKPEYKEWLAVNGSKNLNNMIEYDYKDIDGSSKTVFLDPATREIYDPMNTIGPVNTNSKKAMDLAPGEKGGQCGEFSNKLTGLKATPGGNDLGQRKNAYTDYNPKVGGQVLFVGPNYDKDYGHIATVIGVNIGDGTMTLEESNLKGDELVGIRTVKLNDSQIHGYYNNTPMANGQGQTDKQKEQMGYVESYAPMYAKLTKGDLTATDSNIISDKYPGGFNKFMEDAQNYGKKESLKGLSELESSIANLEMINNSNFNFLDKTSMLIGIGDLGGAYKQYLSKNVLDYLIELKNNGATFGSLSDTESARIEKGTLVGQINAGTSAERFHEIITEELETLKRVKSSIQTDNPYYQEKQATVKGVYDRNTLYKGFMGGFGQTNNKVDTAFNMF